MELRERAALDFERQLEKNPYPGRGLVVGRPASGEGWLVVYWIMGRSDSSRSRRFATAGTALRTEPTEGARLENPGLLVYDAMLELPGLQLVGNGDHVRTAYQALATGGRFLDALASRGCEPDAPNYTPRITALLDLRDNEPRLTLSILKASPADPETTDRFHFRPAPPPPGLGLCLTTYAGDGRPLPSFSGEPLWLPLGSSSEDTLDRFWSALDPANRVALAVKEVSPSGAGAAPRIRNRHA